MLRWAGRIDGRDAFAQWDRYRVRDSVTTQAVAVRRHEIQTDREQAMFQEQVGEAWSWRCDMTGEAV